MSSKVREVTTTSKHFQTHESFFQRILGQKFKNAKRKSQDRKLDIKDRSCEVPVFATIQTPNRELAIIGDTPTPSRRSTPYQRRYTSQQDDESLPYITTLEAMIDQRDISAECSGEQWSLEWEFFIRCYSEGRFNISNSPAPPSQKPEFEFFSAPVPTNEETRLKAVKSCNLPLSTHAMEKYQRLIMLAKKVFLTTMGTISIIDEKNETIKVEGFPGRSQISRNISIGAHVLLSSEPIVILDTVKDWRFKGNPLVKGSPWIRFYAGAPIVTSNCEIVGVFAVFDTQPRESFTMANRRKLMDFARLAMTELELAMEERDVSKGFLPGSQNNPIRQIFRNRDNKFTTPVLPSTGEREAVRARLLQTIEQDAEITRGRDTNQAALAYSKRVQSTRNAAISKNSTTNHSSITHTKQPCTNKSGGNSPNPSLSSFDLDYESGILAPEYLSSRTPRNNPYGETRATSSSSLILKTFEQDNSRANISAHQESRNDSIETGELDGTSKSTYSKSYEEASFVISIIARSLRFDLVYLLRVCPIRPDINESELAGHGLHTEVLVSHGMPDPEPVFDGTLHLRALRSDGGLLYSNQNKVPKDEGCGYQLGILLPVYREHGGRDSCGSAGAGHANTVTSPPVQSHLASSPLSRAGIVLCAFTRESISFSSEELRLFRQFGGALRDVLFKTEL